jgi:hypothetical protein
MFYYDLARFTKTYSALQARSVHDLAKLSNSQRKIKGLGRAKRVPTP